jgi:hypothetical protein
MKFYASVDEACDALGFPPSTADPDAEVLSCGVSRSEDPMYPWYVAWRRADGHACVVLTRTLSEALALQSRQPKGPPNGLWLPVDP